MKKYESAKIELVKFTSEDVICTSGYQALNYGDGDNHIGIKLGNVEGSSSFYNN